jgi:signal peptidase I
MPSSLLKSVGTFLKDLLIIVAAALVISFVVKTFLFRSFYIPSESMMNTLHVNDRIIVNELVPDLFPLQHGDVVVFQDPGGWDPRGQSTTSTTSSNSDFGTAAIDFIATFIGFGGSDSEDHLVKRVIGLPGDHVVCCTVDGKLTVNGKPIDEPYIEKSGHDAASGMEFDVKVPANSLWVMGDNRYNSADSRYNQEKPGHGFVPIDKVVGRAIVISWPLNRWTWLDNYPSTFANDN